MEHLETQVSDLRSFLPGAVPSAAPTSTTTPNANSRPAAHMAGVVIGPGASTAATTPRHPSQSAGSSVSAVGSNSAHPSPLAFAANHNPQPARNHGASVSTPGPVSAHRSHANGGGAGGGGGGGNGGVAATAGAKRKLNDNASDDSSQRQQRSKRNRYISIACNECKRRKIKCNGETPCQRCGNLNLACQYAPNCCSNNFKDSDEFREMRDNVARLQEQVDTLFQSMNALKQETLHLAPIHDRALPFPNSAAVTPSPSTATMSSVHRQDLPPPRAPLLFRGPTSASFTVDLAKNSLRQMRQEGKLPHMDLAAAEGLEDNAVMIEDSPAPSPYQTWPSAAEMPRGRARDPLWNFDKKEMVRLCRLHQEEVGIMYPVLNINNVVSHAVFLCDWMEASSKNGLAPHGIGQDEGINNIHTLELKIIMCIGLVVEGQGYSPKAIQLWDSMQPTVDRMLMSDQSKITNLPFLALVGGYRFLSNDETLAWRVMGQVTRLCFELGIHRRDVIDAMGNDQDRRNAINTFWSAYVLDRRWSFGVGLPFVVHDDKIDPHLPWPDEFPYLVSMVTFSRVCAKVWKLVDFFDPTIMRQIERAQFEELDKEILDWYEKSVPEGIKIDGLTAHVPIPGTPTYDNDRLQIWTRLRLNQIRIWLYTPILHSSTSISNNLDLAQRVVDLAKETIHCLSILNTHADVYRRIQVFYNHFLTSAIACLFLASAHRPGDLSDQCRDPFNMSMGLIEDISSKSHVSQRLWQTMETLKTYAPFVGLADKTDDRRGRQKEQLAMAGMARMSRGGQPPFDVLSSSDRHGSISSTSAGQRASPSPGFIAGFSGPTQPPSRMGSLTPHAGGASPYNGAPSGAAGHGGLSSGGEDAKNGLRLRNEMSRVYEALSNGLGPGDDFFAGSPIEYPDSGQFMPNAEHGVFQRMKKMF
ncbi:hypothetical protein KVR01_000436 [Diaporthe batatas]|uniref:uncharacterized protein n=1 Tax=Diaporthe batatas TaxID=748121 RepID=UPI001D0545DF|nr:uncharacterized protein KVR01_000436 [Diaporthe batatas]KAG8169691.1 hypothetical protein KVR01_000436 [Diaporthe batatas]